MTMRQGYGKWRVMAGRIGWDRADVPGELARLIHQAPSIDPASRFPDAASFRGEIVRIAGNT